MIKSCYYEPLNLLTNLFFGCDIISSTITLTEVVSVTSIQCSLWSDIKGVCTVYMHAWMILILHRMWCFSALCLKHHPLPGSCIAFIGNYILVIYGVKYFFGMKKSHYNRGYISELGHNVMSSCCTVNRALALYIPLHE